MFDYRMTGATIISSLTKELADIFKDDSENDRTFYGFTESEVSYCSENSEAEDAVESNKTSLSTTHHFRLRVALRTRPSSHCSTEEEESDREIKLQEKKNDAKNKGKEIKNKRNVKSEVKEESLRLPSPLKNSGSDSENDESFSVKRDLNIKANKAMLAHLMADLVKMPGAQGLLKKEGVKQKAKGSRPPGSAKRESRNNPERVSRRQTRSMRGCGVSLAPQEKQLELSLEEELLEVHGAPRRRNNPRPVQSKPHVIRLVEDITEEELELVADNMTEKVYNSATGSTCHQCRQKTVDTKTCCRSDDCRGIYGQFCGPCLRNRYGEDVKKALLDPEWQCPPCRGICNCSLCRARDGRCPTGILFPLAQYHGFSDVHAYLSSLKHKMETGEEDL